MKVLDFPLKLSLNLFKPVLIKPSLFKLGLVKPSLNQVSAYHLKTSFSKTRFNLKLGLFLGDLSPCFCIRPYGPYALTLLISHLYRPVLIPYFVSTYTSDPSDQKHSQVSTFKTAEIGFLHKKNIAFFVFSKSHNYWRQSLSIKALFTHFYKLFTYFWLCNLIQFILSIVTFLINFNYCFIVL